MSISPQKNLTSCDETLMNNIDKMLDIPLSFLIKLHVLLLFLLFFLHSFIHNSNLITTTACIIDRQKRQAHTLLQYIVFLCTLRLDDDPCNGRDSLASFLDEGLGTSLDGVDEIASPIFPSLGRNDSGEYY